MTKKALVECDTCCKRVVVELPAVANSWDTLGLERLMEYSHVGCPDNGGADSPAHRIYDEFAEWVTETTKGITEIKWSENLVSK